MHEGALYLLNFPVGNPDQLIDQAVRQLRQGFTRLSGGTGTYPQARVGDSRRNRKLNLEDSWVMRVFVGKQLRTPGRGMWTAFEVGRGNGR